MAYVDLPALKRSLVAQLAEAMPRTDDGNQIPVDYAWPGSAHQRRRGHVWLFNARCVSEYGAMGAGRKRRDQVWTFEIVAEVVYDGAAIDPATKRNIGQEQADATVVLIFGTIDDFVAENPTLGQTGAGDVPVDFAMFGGYTIEQGQPDKGASVRGTGTITVRIRPK